MKGKEEIGMGDREAGQQWEEWMESRSREAETDRDL